MRLAAAVACAALVGILMSACGGQPSPTPTSPPAPTAAAAPIAAATSAPAASPTTATSAPAPAVAPTAKPAEDAASLRPTAAATQPSALSPSAPGLKDVSAGKLADKVTSYRQKMAFRNNGEGVKPEERELTITEAWVKDPPAQHIAMKGMTEQESIEIIQIGKTSYINFGGQWIRADSQDAPTAMSGADMSAWMKDTDAKLVFVGDETVNGVKAKHYTYDVQVPYKLEQGVSVKAKGDVWLADQAPFTGIAVKEKAEIEFVGRVAKATPKAGSAGPAILDWTKIAMERDLTELNQPITIKPPDNVVDLGESLTPQPTGAARTTATPRAAGTPSAQTGVTRTPAAASGTATPAPTARATQAAVVSKGNFTWTKAESDAEQNLYIVLTLANAGGVAFGSAGETLRLSGGKWARFELAEADGLTIADAEAIDGKIVWAVGNQGLILRFDGSKWTRFQSPTEEDLYAIGMSSDKEGWAVGASGTLLRFADNTWKSIDPSPIKPTDSPTSVLMVAASEGWIFGDDGLMMKLKGATWVDAKADPEDEGGINFVTTVPGSKDVWMFGYGDIWRFDGSKWTSMPNPIASAAMRGAAFAAANDGWAVGGGGVILRWNGSEWAKWTSPSKEDLHSVSIAPNGDAWIVGTGPVILKLNR